LIPIFVKTGVLFRDSIVVQTAAGTFVTGLVNGDFTKQLSNGTTGGVSTAGITVTEVSAGSNPGVYDILIPASIFASNGNYTLKLYRTADPTYSWTQEYVATQDGHPGTTGTIAFTATASDGRVVDENGDPVEGATVYLSNTSGFLTSVETNASGLWGPTYWTASFGAVNITVTAPAYSTTTSSMTVGASSVTGPGVDITISPVATSSGISAALLWAYARKMAFNKPGSQADTKIKQAVNDSLDRLAMEKDWNFYVRRGYISLEAPYATGTIALTNGATSCVLTGGTFPTWAAQGRLFVNGLPVIDVLSRTNGTNLVLSAPFGAATGSYSYVLFKDNYGLESNAFQFMGVLNGQNWPYGGDPVTIQKLWEIQNEWANETLDHPWAYAIANNRLHIWPSPSEDTSVAYIYRARPEPLDDEADIADVDPTWISTLRLCINYHIALYFGECVAGSAEQCLARYNDSLARLISNDKTPSGIGGRPSRRSRGGYWHSQGWADA
jgi:hypothetical protein